MAATGTYQWRDPKSPSYFGNQSFGAKLSGAVQNSGGAPSDIANSQTPNQVAPASSQSSFKIPGGDSAGFNSAAFNPGSAPTPQNPQTATASWVRNGRGITLEIPSHSCPTSNTTAMTYTGIPTGIQITSSQHYFSMAELVDNGTAVASSKRISARLQTSTGTLEFLIDNSLTGFTAANSKGNGSVNVISYFQ